MLVVLVRECAAFQGALGRKQMSGIANKHLPRRLTSIVRRDAQFGTFTRPNSMLWGGRFIYNTPSRCVSMRRFLSIQSTSGEQSLTTSITAGTTTSGQLELPPQCTVAVAFDRMVSYFSARGVSEPNESARYLLSHATGAGYSMSQFEASKDMKITPEAHNWLVSAASRRVAGVPVQYILGNWDFYGMQFECAAPVLIPRPETEELVENVLTWCRGSSVSNSAASSANDSASRRGPLDGRMAPSSSPATPRRLRVLDVGCGSGCIGISLLASSSSSGGCNSISSSGGILRGDVEIGECVAIDISPDAVRLATRNADNLLSPALRSRYSVRQVSWRDFALNRDHWGRFDMIISNPPYITTSEGGELQREVIEHESPVALLSGTDGMVMIRDLLLLAPPLFRRDTTDMKKSLWLETGEAHPEHLTKIMLDYTSQYNQNKDDFINDDTDSKLWTDLVHSSCDPMQSLVASTDTISALQRDVHRYIPSSATPIRDLTGRMRFFTVNVV